MGDNYSSHKVFEVEIENIKQDINELKGEVKEIKSAYQDSVVTMKENITKLTVLMENQVEWSKKQEQRSEKQDERLDKISQEIHILRQDIVSNNANDNVDEDKVWYRQIIEQKDKWIMYILLVALGLLFGLKVDDLISILVK